MDNSIPRDFSSITGVSQSCNLTLRERVQFLLLIKHLTFAGLAKEIGCNKGTISKVVNGFWQPTAYIKLKMSEILGVDSLVIFGDKQYFLDYQKTLRVVK